MLLRRIFSKIVQSVYGKDNKVSNVASQLYQITQVNTLVLGTYQVLIKNLHTAATEEYALQDIMNNDKILLGFSIQDIKFIIKLAYEQKYTPKYYIFMQEVCDQFNKIVFKLKQHSGDDIIGKHAGQIFLDKTLLYNLSKEDMCSIAYTAGYEQALAEKIPG
jgi:hypothetical protein